MSCQRCGVEIQQSGSYVKKFCSRSCANVRSFSEESNRKRGKSVSDTMAQKSPEERRLQAANAVEAKARKRQADLLYGNFDCLSGSLKRERIHAEQNGKCAICFELPVWQGRPLTFQLDHVNGNRSNNTRDNLRLLCPNCHSQTDTYCGGNQRVVGDDEMLVALQASETILHAFKVLGLQPSGKNYERAKRLFADVG